MKNSLYFILIYNAMPVIVMLCSWVVNGPALNWKALACGYIFNGLLFILFIYMLRNHIQDDIQNRPTDKK